MTRALRTAIQAAVFGGAFLAGVVAGGAAADRTRPVGKGAQVIHLDTHRRGRQAAR